MTRLLAFAGYALLSALLLSAPAASQGSIFDGKTITYVVATKPGGGYDTMGRLVARYLEKHLPGAKVIVKNVPGAGHLVGAKTIFAADPDGLTIGTFNTGLINIQLTGENTSDLDLTKMSWIGKAAAESRVLVLSTKSSLKSLDDFRKPDRKVKMAASGKGSASHQDTTILARALGLNIEIITGFEGTEAEMSMMRGEVDAYLGSASSLQSFIDNGNGKILLEIGGTPRPDVPQARDLADNDTAKALIANIETQSHLSRLTGGPPGIPEAELKTLRDAYMAALADPDLLAEAEKLGLPIAPADGETVAKSVGAAFDLPPETLALLKELLQGE